MESDDNIQHSCCWENTDSCDTENLPWEQPANTAQRGIILRGLLATATLILLISGLLPNSFNWALALIAWGIAGGDIVLRASLNILKGRFFDEKFLVTLTTLGAFFLGAWGEGALVMLFFMIGEHLEYRAIQKSRRGIVVVPEPFNHETTPLASLKAPTEKMITRFARLYTPVVMILALLVACIPPLLFRADFTTWIYRGLVIFVASCPCSLVIAIPLTFYAGIGLASRSGIFFRGGNYLSALARTSAIVFDKRGILTRGAYRLDKITPVSAISQEQLIEAAAIAMSRATDSFAKPVLDIFGAIPEAYEGDSSVETPGQGITVVRKGIRYVAGISNFMASHNIDVAKTELSSLHIAVDETYYGEISFVSDIRADAPSAIEALRRMGIARTILLSPESAELTGETAGRLGIGEVYSEISDSEKIRLVEELAKLPPASKTLVYVGDSSADSESLACADVGLAIGFPGSRAAIDASNVALMTNEPSYIARAIAIARHTSAIARQNIALVLAFKGCILIAGFFGLVSIWGAVFADISGALLAILNTSRLALRKR